MPLFVDRPHRHATRTIGASLAALAVLAIGGPAAASDVATTPPESVSTSPAPVVIEASPAAIAIEDIAVEVHRAPNCGCCTGWEAYMLDQGFTVESWEDPGLTEFKIASGVPMDAMSCHTAIIDGYVVEGHVPIEAILDLLEQRPDIDGIALPGMPQGSPGMPGEQVVPFEILAFDDGTASIFGSYPAA